MLLAGVAGCGTQPADEPGRPVEETNLESENGGADEPTPESENGGSEEPAPETGNGGDEERASQFEATRKAAEQGNAEAQFNLGGMYANGLGVPEDQAEAAKWYRKAAEQGHAEAQCSLGVMYQFGRGVSESDTEAYAWMAVATANGAGPKAIEHRNKIKRELSPARLAQAQKRTIELFEQINANEAK